MSKFFHQVASIFGPALILVEKVAPLLPGKAGNVGLTIAGIAATLVASLPKAWGLVSLPTDKGA